MDRISQENRSPGCCLFWLVLARSEGPTLRESLTTPRTGSTSTSVHWPHIGVLYNDDILRKYHKLPTTDIETDSYVAVQLIEQKRALSFDSLSYTAEEVEGSFCFTVLDE